MRCEFPNILGEEEIRALAIKWWGNGILPPHYFEALKEAARLGAERALHATADTEKPGAIAANTPTDTEKSAAIL